MRTHLNPSPVRFTNPEGAQEYLKPGDILSVIVDMMIYSFNLPGATEGHGGSGERKSIIEVHVGDIIKYIGMTYKGRSGGIMKPIPVYAFALIVLDDFGKEKSERKFYMPNVESVLKWTERLEEE